MGKNYVVKKYRRNSKARHKQNDMLIAACLAIASIVAVVAIIWGNISAGAAVPTVSLIGDETTIVEVGTEFIDSGVNAMIGRKKSDKITVSGNVDTSKVGEYVLTYTATNKKGKNPVEITRTVKVVDTTAPAISIIGGEAVVAVGSKFMDPGCKAIDNYDGDISASVKVTSNINYYKEGSYEVKYKITDKNGNTSEATRVVNVKSSPNKTIYLTFDDGPSALTPQFLDKLKQYGAKATFFVTNAYSDYGKDVIKRMVNEGHAVGLHPHEYEFIYSADSNFWSEIDKMKSEIKSFAGYDCKIFRFAGGSSNTVSMSYSKGIMTRLCKQAMEKGWKYFDWNISSGDAEVSPTKEKIAQRVIAGIGSGYQTPIILMHDTKQMTLQALDEILAYACNNGYSFGVLDENTPMVTHGVAN